MRRQDPEVPREVPPSDHGFSKASLTWSSNQITLFKASLEDHEGVHAFARTLLRKLGYQVLSANNGKTARDLAQGHAGPIDLLITDVIMPGLNGRQLAVQLAEQRPDLRVLFTSGYAEDVVVHHGVLEPDVHFVGKPYSLATLSAKVRSILDQPR